LSDCMNMIIAVSHVTLLDQNLDFKHNCDNCIVEEVIN